MQPAQFTQNATFYVSNWQLRPEFTQKTAYFFNLLKMQITITYNAASLKSTHDAASSVLYW